MLNNTFHIYCSAAGSGKTRALAKAYLLLALRSRAGSNYFKHILAVTFTNKSTQEMKERILHYLDDFSKGKDNTLSRELRGELRLTDEQLKDRSIYLLSSILHNYSDFSVSTIDSFFQRVIRSFSRESGFLGDFQLELDTDLVLDEVLKALMNELGDNEQLTKWVVTFSRRRLMEGKNWDVMKELSSFAGEIFTERFKAIEDEIDKPLGEHSQYSEKLELLQKEIKAFEYYMHKKATAALNALKEHAIDDDYFKYRDKGTVLKYFREFSKKRYYSSEGNRIQSALEGGINWYRKDISSSAHIVAFTDKKLMPILQAMVQFDKQKSAAYLSARTVLKNFYAYGLLADIARKLEQYRNEHNLLLISEVSTFIHKIISDSDITFLYEKIGSHFFHYLIDEFQDTSLLQWKNFFPLLKEALDRGSPSFLVGDEKQSIYRWRGGDPGLLRREVPASMGVDRVKIDQLDVNYRSSDNIVRFNNTLFEKASRVLSDLTSPLIREAYDNVAQKTGASRQNPGYVCLRFLPKKHTDGVTWQEAALDRLPLLVEQLQDNGVRLGDIALLTRKKEEGQRIATAFLHYKSEHAKPGYRYDVISDESIRLDAASSVKLLLVALRYIHTPYDSIARMELAYRIKKTTPLKILFVEPSLGSTGEVMPDEIIEKMKDIAGLILYEMVEELTALFQLNEISHERPYLQGFQNVVLEFTLRKKHELADFLTYWENKGDSHSAHIAGETDAIHILTIHKSKGLQFKCVIVPFLDWKLDHEPGKHPLLWVKSLHSPFEKMGFLAVRYDKGLQQTHFSEAYHKERMNIYLDNLNLLYVAFTRAEEHLIAYAPKPRDSRKEPTTASELVYCCLDQHAGNDRFDGEMFRVGEMMSDGDTCSVGAEPSPMDTLHMALKNYPFYPWRKKLLSLSKGEHVVMPHGKKTGFSRGNMVHELLARLRYKNEADRVLHQFFVQKMLVGEERDELAEIVKKIFAHPVVSKWFDKNWIVETEVPILLPRGTSRTRRIDRIMTDARQTVIVDYKTGIENVVEHREQVREYIRLMGQAGIRCSGYLLYLTSMRIVPVTLEHTQ